MKVRINAKGIACWFLEFSAWSLLVAGCVWWIYSSSKSDVTVEQPVPQATYTKFDTSSWDRPSTIRKAYDPTLFRLKLAAEDMDAVTAREAALNAATERIDAFFRSRNTGAAKMAKSALSLESKILLAKGIFDEGEAHRKFLSDEFGKHLFSQEEISDLLKSVIAELVTTLDGIDNKVLISLRADLPVIPGTASQSTSNDNETICNEYQRTLVTCAAVTNNELAVQITKQLVDWVIAEVLERVVTHLVEKIASKLGASEADISKTKNNLGVRLGVGLVMGEAVGGVTDQLMRDAGYNPESAAELNIRYSLEDMRGLLITGVKPVRVMNTVKIPGDSMKQPGLIGDLRRMAVERTKLRNIAIERMIQNRLNEGGAR